MRPLHLLTTWVMLLSLFQSWCSLFSYRTTSGSENRIAVPCRFPFQEINYIKFFPSAISAISCKITHREWELFPFSLLQEGREVKFRSAWDRREGKSEDSLLSSHVGGLSWIKKALYVWFDPQFKCGVNSIKGGYFSHKNSSSSS